MFKFLKTFGEILDTLIEILCGFTDHPIPAVTAAKYAFYMIIFMIMYIFWKHPIF